MLGLEKDEEHDTETEKEGVAFDDADDHHEE